MLKLGGNGSEFTDVEASDDADAEGLTYSLTTVGTGGADNALFTLDPPARTLSICVRTDDHNGGTLEQVITVFLESDS